MPVKHSYVDLLAATPLAELRYRAAVVTDLAGTGASHARSTRSYRVEGATRYATNDSGGQNAIWYFTDDGRVLLCTFMHDSEANVAGDLELQRSFYSGVPADLLRLAADRTEAYENIRAEADGECLLAATGVGWYDGTTWRVSEGPRAYCEEYGLAPAESGLANLDPYLLGREFTPETYLDEYFLADDWLGPSREVRLPAQVPGPSRPDRETLLTRIRPIFQRHRALRG